MSFLVVFLTPSFDDGLGVGQASEPVIIQAFIAQATIERLDVRILIRLAWLDQAQSHAVAVNLDRKAETAIKSSMETPRKRADVSLKTQVE